MFIILEFRTQLAWDSRFNSRIFPTSWAPPRSIHLGNVMLFNCLPPPGAALSTWCGHFRLFLNCNSFAFTRSLSPTLAPWPGSHLEQQTVTFSFPLVHFFCVSYSFPLLCIRHDRIHLFRNEERCMNLKIIWCWGQTLNCLPNELIFIYLSWCYNEIISSFNKFVND